MIQTVCGCSSRYPLVLADEMVGKEVVCPYSGMAFYVRSGRPFGAAEWDRCREPELLRQCVERLGYRFSARKRRLLACACCRRNWHRLTDERSRHAVVTAERYADGLANRRNLRIAWEGAQAVVTASGARLLPTWARIAASCAEEPVGRAWPLRDLRELETSALLAVVRDLLGNPFRPLPTLSFPPPLLGLAGDCHDGDHVLFPLLADALDDLGEEPLAAHCREPEHARGCYVVDWILGRS
jgi:hypothetical protein